MLEVVEALVIGAVEDEPFLADEVGEGVVGPSGAGGLVGEPAGRVGMGAGLGDDEVAGAAGASGISARKRPMRAGSISTGLKFLWVS